MGDTGIINHGRCPTDVPPPRPPPPIPRVSWRPRLAIRLQQGSMQPRVPELAIPTGGSSLAPVQKPSDLLSCCCSISTWASQRVSSTDRLLLEEKSSWCLDRPGCRLCNRQSSRRRARPITRGETFLAPLLCNSTALLTPRRRRRRRHRFLVVVCLLRSEGTLAKLPTQLSPFSRGPNTPAPSILVNLTRAGGLGICFSNSGA